MSNRGGGGGSAVKDKRSGHFVWATTKTRPLDKQGGRWWWWWGRLVGSASGALLRQYSRFFGEGWPSGCSHRWNPRRWMTQMCSTHVCRCLEMSICPAFCWYPWWHLTTPLFMGNYRRRGETQLVANSDDRRTLAFSSLIDCAWKRRRWWRRLLSWTSSPLINPWLRQTRLSSGLASINFPLWQGICRWWESATVLVFEVASRSSQ